MATGSQSDVFSTVVDPSRVALGDGQDAPMGMGRQNDLYTSEAHGRFYTMAYRGVSFCARSPVAGSVIPVNSATAQTFAVINPPGSGVNLEVLAIRVDLSATGTYVAAEIYLNVVTGTPFAVLAAGTVTLIAGGVQSLSPATALQALPKSLAASAVTSVSQADKHVCGVGGFDPVTTGAGRNLIRSFDGGLILGPGSCSFLTGTAAQTSIAHIEFVYNEVPV